MTGMFDDLLGGSPSRSNLDIALDLARRGIPVFPCREREDVIDGEVRKEKSPATRRGFKDATTDEAQIRTWWQKRPAALVGLPTGAASGLAVVDLDRHKADADGVVALTQMGLKPAAMTPVRVKTAGGGLHLYFRWEDGITNTARHLPDGIDVRGEGGFVIAPGAFFPDGRAYSDADLSAAVPAFPARLKAPAVEHSGADGGDKDSTGLSVEQIRAYMADLPNTSDIDRQAWIGYIASLNHEANASDADGRRRTEDEIEAIKQIAIDWTRSNPDYASDKHVAEVVRDFNSFKNSAHKNLRTFRSIIMEVDEMRRERGVENDFDEVDDLEDDDDEGSDLDGMFDDILGDGSKPSIRQSRSQQRLAREEVEHALSKDTPKWVSRLNKKFAIAVVSGKTVVLHFKQNGRVDYGSVNDLNTFHENDRVSKDDTTVPITKVWMQSKFRRTYPEGIIFAPNRETEGAYNHWQGFSVEPSTARDPSRGCKLFLKHLREVICDGNEDYYRYQLGWLAHMIQKPEDKPGVAVVYRGQKRIGKDTVFEYMGELFKNHYVTVANQDHMIGKFNQHQEKCLLLHVQEGFWAGNKQAEGSLKYLITSTQVTIEPKGVNAFQVPSVLRLFISSNERWVVPATEDEARYFVLNVSDKRRSDHAYFSALRAEMNGDGPASLLAYLQQYDISNFEVRAVPNTEALGEQKIQGLKNIEAWWLDCLQASEIVGSRGPDEGVDGGDWEKGAVRIDKGDFRDAYSNWMRSRRYDGSELNEVEFGIRMKRLCPSLEVKQIQSRGRRSREYVLGDLGQCRQDFEDFLGNTVSWPSVQPLVIESGEEDDL